MESSNLRMRRAPSELLAGKSWMSAPILCWILPMSIGWGLTSEPLNSAANGSAYASTVLLLTALGLMRPLRFARAVRPYLSGLLN